MTSDALENLLGQEFTFFGVDGNAFKLGRQVFEAIEDDVDGYRSYLGSIQRSEADDLIFPKRSIATVCVKEDPACEGYQLVDVEDGHVWLQIGTDHSDDYYPCFVFNYQPKPPQGEKQ